MKKPNAPADRVCPAPRLFWVLFFRKKSAPPEAKRLNGNRRYRINAEAAEGKERCGERIRKNPKDKRQNLKSSKKVKVKR